MLDQFEKRVLGLVDVLEHEHGRRVEGETLRLLAGGPGDLLLAALPVHGLEHPGGQTEQIGHGLVLAADDELLDRLVERIVVGDARRALHHLGERPVGDAFAVGQRPSAEDRCAVEQLRELVCEAALAHARLAVEGEDMRAPVADGTVERASEQVELDVAPHTRRAEATCRRAVALRSERAPDPDRFGAPLEAERPDVLDLNATEGEAVRGGPDQNLVPTGSLLQASGDVDRVARCKRRIAVVRDHLARLDSDPRLELELANGVENGEPCPDCAFGVVLVRLRDPERRHDCITGELLDDPAVRRDAVRDLVEELRNATANNFRVTPLDERGRLDEIGEQHGRKLPLHAANTTEKGPAAERAGPSSGLFYRVAILATICCWWKKR